MLPSPILEKSKRNQRISGQLPRGKSPANASRSLCYRPECQTVMRTDERRCSKNSQRFGYLRKWMMAEQWKLLEFFDNFIQNEFNWLTNDFIKISMKFNRINFRIGDFFFKWRISDFFKDYLKRPLRWFNHLWTAGHQPFVPRADLRPMQMFF